MVCETPLPEMIVTLALAVFSSFGISDTLSGRPKKIERSRRYTALHGSVNSKSRFENALDVRRLRKEIERLQTLDAVAGGGEHRDVARQRSRIARDVHDAPRPKTSELRDLGSGARPRRVEDDELCAGESLLLQEVERGDRVETRVHELARGGARPRVGDRRRARVDADHVGACTRERQAQVAGAAEEVEDPPIRSGDAAYGLDEEAIRCRIHLAECSGVLHDRRVAAGMDDHAHVAPRALPPVAREVDADDPCSGRLA